MTRSSPENTLAAVDACAHAVHGNINAAIQAHHVMESANKLVLSGKAKRIGFNSIYDIIHRGLVVDIVLCLSRLFEKPQRGRHETSDHKSFAIAIHHLKREEVRDALVQRVGHLQYGNRTRDVDVMERARQAAIGQYDAFISSDAGKEMLKRLSDFRSHQLAHDIKEVIERPAYGDLEKLLATAIELGSNVGLAVDGDTPNYKWEGIAVESRMFWTGAFQFMRGELQPPAAAAREV